MYTVCKRFEISACHQLKLDYDSPCARLHGHNWLITVYCRSEVLDESGMVVDMSLVKRIVKDKMDHQNLNEVFVFNPTSENIARWIVDNVPKCFKAVVRENENNEVTYEI